MTHLTTATFSNFSIPEILNYGIIGLGFLLAFLSYRLLVKEQAIEQPRTRILKAIYVFMSFSLCILGLGLFLKLKELNSEEVILLKAQNKIINNAINFNPSIISFDDVRDYVDASYSDAFILKVIESSDGLLSKSIVIENSKEKDGVLFNKNCK